MGQVASVEPRELTMVQPPHDTWMNMGCDEKDRGKRRSRIKTYPSATSSICHCGLNSAPNRAANYPASSRISATEWIFLKWQAYFRSHRKKNGAKTKECLFWFQAKANFLFLVNELASTDIFYFFWPVQGIEGVRLHSQRDTAYLEQRARRKSSFFMPKGFFCLRLI